MIQLGILFALLCAFATNLGFLYKHRGAHAAPPVDIRHPLRTARSLFASKWFAIGMGVAVGAWILHVIALSMAPISVVQVVLSGGVVLLGVMAERMFGFKVRAKQWIGIGLTALGLVLLGVTLPAGGGAHSQFSLAAMLGFEGGLVVIGGLLIMGPHVVGARREHHGVALAAASGILFGVSDIAIKALTGLISDQGLLGIASPWLALTVAASIAAFYASARGLQVGEAVPVIAVTGSAANVVGIAGGILVFGDPMPGSVWGILAEALAFAMVCVAAAIVPAPIRATRGSDAPAAAAA